VYRITQLTQEGDSKMEHFSEFRFCCPKCGSGKFHKRGGIHLIAKYRCHRCKCTFTNPMKMKQYSNVSQSSHNIQSNKKATIKHKRPFIRF
jgi:transposase-like protein